MSGRNTRSSSGASHKNEQVRALASGNTQNTHNSQEGNEPVMAMIQKVLDTLEEVKDDVKANSTNIASQVHQIGEVQETTRQSTQELQKLRDGMENPSPQLIQVVKAQIQQETMGPSCQAQILNYANQIVINGIPYSARNLDIPLAQTVVT